MLRILPVLLLTLLLTIAYLNGGKELSEEQVNPLSKENWSLINTPRSSIIKQDIQRAISQAHYHRASQLIQSQWEENPAQSYYLLAQVLFAKGEILKSVLYYRQSILGGYLPAVAKLALLYERLSSKAAEPLKSQLEKQALSLYEYCEYHSLPVRSRLVLSHPKSPVRQLQLFRTQISHSNMKAKALQILQEGAQKLQSALLFRELAKFQQSQDKRGEFSSQAIQLLAKINLEDSHLLFINSLNAKTHTGNL